MILFNCKNCGKGLKAKQEQAGKNAKCPNCGAVAEIPGPRASLEEVGLSIHGQRPSLDEVAPLKKRSSNGPSLATSALGAQRRTAAPSQSASRGAYHPPGRGKGKWAVLFIAVGIVAAGGVAGWVFDLPSRVGVSFGNTDICKVVADPEAYAGQTLTSMARVDGVGEVGFFMAPIGDSGALCLSVPNWEGKPFSVANAAGKYRPIMIRYRIHDRATLAGMKIEGHLPAAPGPLGTLIDIWIP